MKKVMILTASTGEGHNQAAKSLQEQYEEKGYLTYKIDFLKEASAVMNTLVSDGYRVMAQNFPGVYGRLYETADKKGFNKVTRGGYFAIERKIGRRFREIQPDVVVATHPFAVGLVERLKSRMDLNFTFISVVTDFKAHYSYVSPSVDAYITGSEYTKRTLVERSIPADRVYSYGIPVKRDFQQHCDPPYIHPGHLRKFRVLIMGGSMGSKDIFKVVTHLVEESNDYFLDVVCGNNKVLQDGLKKRFASFEVMGKMKIHGYARNVPDLMDAANLIVTKPGGLTTTEALFKKLPMMIPFAIPGQEIENAEFLVREGVAVFVDDIATLSKRIEKLKNNPRLYNRMVSNMKRISDTYSMEKIIDLSDRLIVDRSAYGLLSTHKGGA